MDEQTLTEHEIAPENVWEIRLASGETITVEADEIETPGSLLVLSFDDGVVFCAPMSEVVHAVKVEAKVTLGPLAIG